MFRTLQLSICVGVFLAFVTPDQVAAQTAPQVSHPGLPHPSPAPIKIKVVDMTPASLSGETSQDSEPFLSVRIASPSVMVGTAFTENPVGLAPLYVSQDNGNNWSLNFVVPTQFMFCDMTHAMATSGHHSLGSLYGGFDTDQCSSGILNLHQAKTDDVALGNPMSVVYAEGEQGDQPFVRAFTAPKNDRIYVGNNEFNNANINISTATVDVSVDSGQNWGLWPIDARPLIVQDGPSIRPAIADDGTVYAAFFRWRNFVPTIPNDYCRGLITADVVVVRDDAGPGINTPPHQAFRALRDLSDGLPGRIVTEAIKIPWSSCKPALGQERIGSTLSLAVDRLHSSTVYVGWADAGNGGNYTLHVRRSTDKGVTWSKDLPRATIPNATNIALAVADNGVVGLLYQQLINVPSSLGNPAQNRWATHLLQSNDQFTTIQDYVLASVPADTPTFKFLPYLGDYDYLLAIGNEFRGVFCANNTPDLANFPQGVKFQRSVDFVAKKLKNGTSDVPPSIDPFYFSAQVFPFQVAADPPSLTQRSDLVFLGSVVRPGSSFPGAPISSRTTVVRVLSIWKKPDAISLKPGDEVTVEMSSSSRLRPSTHAVFYTTLSMLGAGVAVKELGHVASAPGQAIQQQRQFDTAQSQLRDQELRNRLKSADAVVVGGVVDVRPSIISKRQLITEHYPDWQDAIVNVESTLKGAPTKILVIRFPASEDVAWYKTPKLTRGQHGVFLLRADNHITGGQPYAAVNETQVRAYTALVPGDVLEVSEVHHLQALLHK